MKLLSLECSAGPASVAVSEDGQILAEFYANVKLTHSETLLPMVQNALSAARLEMGEIDGFAVACGPGSFTGVRIGVAALKGMAWAAGKPCAAVSSLEGMALLLSGCRGVIVAAMDARCKQVYNALFYADGEVVRRLCPDRALMLEELSAELDTLAAGDVCRHRLFLLPETARRSPLTRQGWRESILPRRICGISARPALRWRPSGCLPQVRLYRPSG